MKYKNIKKIKDCIGKNQGFDVIIIVSSNGNSKYWQERLSQTREEILPQKTKIISIEENWQGRAGQLLGTLAAFENVSKEINLRELLKNKGTIAIYHTAGYGKRMAPLCGTEGNNKPAVKLLKPIKIFGSNNLLNLLEATILSTQIFAPSREGQLCVFWSDQVIIPSRTPKKETKLPVEIFGIKKKFSLSPEEWRENWQNYGILIPTTGPSVLQREKLKWEDIETLQKQGHLKIDSKGRTEMARSMGCFSISLPFLEALLEEFSPELKSKKRELNTDPDLWMPLTSFKKEYLLKEENELYWQRIKKFKRKFEKKHRLKVLVGEKNLGQDTLWWDYGNLANYYKNFLKALENSDEGIAVREFYEIDKHLIKEKKSKELKIYNSIIINSEIEKGEIQNSIILNSKIKKIRSKRSIIINSNLRKAFVKNSLFYYLQEGKQVRSIPREVITDIALGEGTKIRMRTTILRDGKKDWKVRLPRNIFSYSEIERCLSRLANHSFKIKL